MKLLFNFTTYLGKAVTSACDSNGLAFGSALAQSTCLYRVDVGERLEHLAKIVECGG